MKEGRANKRRKSYDARVEIASQTDEVLIKEVLREPEQFGHIIERYETKLSRYINRLGVRGREDQEDVLQEIFIKVYKNLNGFDQSLKFSSWIYRIAHNEAISWFRKHSVRPEGHLVGDSEAVFDYVRSAEPDQETLFDGEVNAKVLSTALNALDAKYKSVLILRFYEQYEYEEISDILQIPVGSVGTLIHRGKQQLRKQIDPEHIRL